MHINDELFAGMRKSADRVLQKLLHNMVEKDSPEGKLTITIDVTLIPDYILNCDPNIKGETRRVLTPKFSHKVGSVMQIKDEAKGNRDCDGTELVWDDEKGEYVLRPIANTEQISIFDSNFNHTIASEEIEVGIDEEQPAIEGSNFAALPGPVDCVDLDNEVDEADYDEDYTADDMSEEFEDDGYGYEEPGEY